MYIFSCVACKKMVTSSLESRLSCLQSRLNIKKRGHLSYRHVPDLTFDINSYVIDLKSQMVSWREVYWRLWGQINYLKCSRCDQVRNPLSYYF